MRCQEIEARYRKVHLVIYEQISASNEAELNLVQHHLVLEKRLVLYLQLPHTEEYLPAKHRSHQLFAIRGPN